MQVACGVQVAEWCSPCPPPSPLAPCAPNRHAAHITAHQLGSLATPRHQTRPQAPQASLVEHAIGLQARQSGQQRARNQRHGRLADELSSCGVLPDEPVQAHAEARQHAARVHHRLARRADEGHELAGDRGDQEGDPSRGEALGQDEFLRNVRVTMWALGR